jgi:hypothetical protein
MLLRMESDFSHRVLVDDAEGWFLAARRDERTGHGVAFYSEHALSEQRAYQIMCMMVGSDKFRDLATETKLPESRQPVSGHSLRSGFLTSAAARGARCSR